MTDDVVKAARRIVAALGDDWDWKRLEGDWIEKDGYICARYILSLAPGKDVVEAAREIVTTSEYICGPCGAPLPNPDCGHAKNGVVGCCVPSTDQPLVDRIAAFATACVAKEIERHRAEVAALEKWRDDALETFYNICVKALGWTDPRKHHSNVPPPEWTQGKISDGVKAEMDKLRSKNEQLTRERDDREEAKNKLAANIVKLNDALAAAQKRVGELEGRLREIDEGVEQWRRHVLAALKEPAPPCPPTK